MEKEEILQKYRREGVDEGAQERNRRGDDAGFYALCILALVLMIYQALAGQVFGDVAAVLFVFSSVGSFARYRMDRDRFFLAWVFSPVYCAWGVWGGMCGTRCKGTLTKPAESARRGGKERHGKGRISLADR